MRKEFVGHLYGEAIPHVRYARYLGVWFDEHLTWRHHLAEVRHWARVRLWELRQTISSDWGLCPSLFMRIVRGAILSDLFFGAPIWASILRYNTRLGELNGILALVAKMAFSLKQFASIEASLALVGVMPTRQHILRSLA